MLDSPMAWPQSWPHIRPSRPNQLAISNWNDLEVAAVCLACSCLALPLRTFRKLLVAKSGGLRPGCLHTACDSRTTLYSLHSAKQLYQNNTRLDIWENLRTIFLHSFCCIQLQSDVAYLGAICSESRPTLPSLQLVGTFEILAPCHS